MSRTKFQNLNSHLVILDVRAETDIRLMNVYRCFSPQDATTARSHFHNQGASWSSGLIRLPTAPRVRGSNPGLSLSFIRFQKCLEEAFSSKEERK